VLEFFGIDLKAKAARTLGSVLEEKLLKDHPPGLYRCSLDDTFALTPLAEDEPIPAAGGPILLFLHGTASSCAGSFGKLWAPDNREGKVARERFQARYGERAFAFEHRSLTESPVSNALALVRRLPKGAQLHLVSHSRGGLVGELLCLGQCEGVATLCSTRPPHPTVRRRPHDRRAARPAAAVAEGANPKARDHAYDADRAALAEAHRARSSEVRVTRFVRAACPARGTTLASGRLDRWLSMLDFLAGKRLGGGLFADGLDFLLAVVKERTDPRTLPGLEAMMPGSALTRLLHHPELVTAADLSVIAGDVEGASVWQKIKLLVTDWFYGADHDLVVNTGVRCPAACAARGGARFRLDRGAHVNHFSYFPTRTASAGCSPDSPARRRRGGFLPIALRRRTPPRWREAVARSQRHRPAPARGGAAGHHGQRLTPAGAGVAALLVTVARRAGQESPWAARIAPTDLIDDFYGPLLEFLATHRVEFFPYDWRLSVRAAAARSSPPRARRVAAAGRA
jgi:hypothetical protein